jgi:hypothetical protein
VAEIQHLRQDETELKLKKMVGEKGKRRMKMKLKSKFFINNNLILVL